MKFKLTTILLTLLIFLNVVSACGASQPSNKIVFLGDSMIKRGHWSTYFHNKNIVNLGIGGNKTTDVLQRLDQVAAENPKKIFLMVGINDILQLKNPKETVKNYDEILSTLSKKLPKTRIYVMSVLPLNEKKTHEYRKGTQWVSPDQVNQLNAEIKKMSKTKSHVTYIDLFPKLVQNGQVLYIYSSDGLHLNQVGYNVWAREIKADVK
jgi:lysophospholipase L1-like esterase